MATTKVAIPRPPRERPPERQRKRPGVRYVRRELLPPLESSKVHVPSKKTKEFVEPRSYRAQKTEPDGAARPTTAVGRSKRAALPELQRVKRVKERKDAQSSKSSSRLAEDRDARRNHQRESIPHQGHSTRSYNKKVPGEESCVTTRRQSSEVESKQHKSRSIQGHPRESPRRKPKYDTTPLDDSSVNSSPSSSVLSDDSYSTALSYESVEKERAMYAEHKAEVQRLLEEERAFQKKYPLLLEQLKRRKENVQAAEEASAKLELTYKKEVEFFRTQLEEVYKNTSVLVTTLQNVEKEKKKAEEMKREQENERMMEMRKQMLKRILDEHLTHAHKDDDDIESMACRYDKTNSTSTQTNEVETQLQSTVPTPLSLSTKPKFTTPNCCPAVNSTSTQTYEVENTLQSVVPEPSPQSTKPSFTKPSHNLTANSTSTQTDEVKTPLEPAVPAPPPLSAQPSFTRPSRYLKSKLTKESSQRDGSHALTDGDAKKVESPLQSQSTIHQQTSLAQHECSSVTVSESTQVPKTLTGSNADIVFCANSSPKATNSHEMSSPDTNMMTKSELEEKLLKKIAQFNQLLQDEADQVGVNNTHRLSEVQKLVSAIKKEMTTTANISSKLVEERQQDVSAPKTLTCESDVNTECNGSGKLNLITQSISTTEKVRVSEETSNPSTSLDLQQKPLSAVDEYMVELPAVTSPYSLHCGPVEKMDVSQSNKSTESALSSVQDIASAMSSSIISEVLSDRFREKGRGTQNVNTNGTKTPTEAVGDEVETFPASPSASDITHSSTLVQSQSKTCDLHLMAGSIPITAEVSTESTDLNDPADLQNEPPSTDEEYIVELPAVTSPYSLHCGTAESIDVSQSNKSTESGPSSIQELAAVISSSIVSEVLSNQSRKGIRAAENENANNTNVSTAEIGDKVTNSFTMIGDIPPPASLQSVDLNVSSAATLSSTMAGQELATNGCSSFAHSVPISSSQKSNATSEASIKAQSTDSSVTIFTVASKKEINEVLPSEEMATSESTNETELEKDLSGCSSKNSDMKNASSRGISVDNDTTGRADDAASSSEYQDAKVSFPLTTVTSSNVEAADSSGSTASTITVLLSAESNISHVTVVLTAPSNECLSNSSDLISCGNAEVTADGQTDACVDSTSEIVATSVTKPDGTSSNSSEDNQEALSIGIDVKTFGADGSGKDCASEACTSASATDETGVLTDSGEHATQSLPTVTGVDSGSSGSNSNGTGDETSTVTPAKSDEETNAPLENGCGGDNATEAVTSTSMKMCTTPEVSSAVTAEENGVLTNTTEFNNHTNASTDTDTEASGENDGENSSPDDVFATVNVESGALTSSSSHGQQNCDCNCGSNTTSVGDVGESSTSEFKGEPKSCAVLDQKEICTCTSSTVTRGTSATNSVVTKSNGKNTSRSAATASASSVNKTKKAAESATSFQANAEFPGPNSKEKSAENKVKSRTSIIGNTSGSGSTMSTKSSRQHCRAGVRKAESDPSGSKLPSQALKDSKCKSLASFRTSDMEKAVKKRSKAAELGLTRPKSKPNMIPVNHKNSDPTTTPVGHKKSDTLVLPKLDSSSKSRYSEDCEEPEDRARSRAVTKSSKETLSGKQSSRTLTHGQSSRSHSRSSMKQGDISLPELCKKEDLISDISETGGIPETQKSEDKLTHSPSTCSRGSTKKCANHEPVNTVAITSSSKNLEDGPAPTISNTRVSTSTRSFRKYSKAVQKASSSSGSSSLPSDILKESKFSKSLASFRTSDVEQAAHPKEKRSRAAELGLYRAKSKPNTILRKHKSSDSSLKRCSKDSCCECNEMPDAGTSTIAVKKSSEKTTAGNSSTKKVTRSRSDRSHCRPSQSMKQRSKSFPEQNTKFTE